VKNSHVRQGAARPPRRVAGARAFGRTDGGRPIRIGISSCLLGNGVRFDGGHKRDAFLTDTFGPFVEWVAVCPEVECGLGTPRPSMRLVHVEGAVRLRTVREGIDLTDRMSEYVERRVEDLALEDLGGYVLKKDSPTCGLERVRIYHASGAPERAGRGIFASRLVERFPHLPVEEEGRLSDPRLRENFVERVFAYANLRDLFRSRWTTGALVRFHTAHKLTLMAHAPEGYRRLGRLVADASSMSRDDMERLYTADFMATLATIATPRRHVNVLQHMVGYFKHRMDRASRTEFLAAVDDYGCERLPLIVPITLLRHHVRVHDISYLANQQYLSPYPLELMLRNHV
jgi:uncharacterized protein YbgA (DUF1722 family)/uncharacterized protein YbbK (DUF523 family)